MLNPELHAVEEQDATAAEYPSLITRYQSLFIDAMLLIVCMIVISNVLGDNDELAPGWARGALFVLLFGMYEPLLVSLGGTLGNRLMRIKVVREDDKQRSIGIVKSYTRFVVKFVLGWISFVSIHSNPRRRAIHDMAGGSVVVKR